VLLDKDGEYSWIDLVTNEEVFCKDDEERNILHAKQRRQVGWVGHICRRSCLSNRLLKER
jgi:hypothetical protein